jgi:RHS repeat-associated protein
MMRQTNRGMSTGLQSAGANSFKINEEFRQREIGGPAARQIFFGLLASLVVALPGYAQEFRGNPYALGGSSKTADTSAGVDGTSGAATLSIPIAVAPGPAGLAPSLSLNYSSDGGDGPFGLGWNLQLGEIRCTARFGVPEDYANCAEFEIDGQLIVGPDTRPGMEGRYHTQVESFQKIMLQGTGASAYWEVTSPGGTRRLYGATTDSKIGSDGQDTPSTAPTARWLLSKIVDLHGNEILITYDRSNVGVAYPETISYAWGAREIAFVYEDRPDKIFDFPGGIPRNITKRLHEIKIKSLDTIFSRRLITYSTPGDYSTHRSRIASTQLFGKDCDDPDPVANCPSLPAQAFEYTKTATGPHWPSTPDPTWNTGFFVENYQEWGIWSDAGKRIADVDGDGLPDLVVGRCPKNVFPCAQPGQGPTVYINDGAGWVENEAWTNAIDSLTYEVPTITLEIITAPSPFNSETICDATYGTLERRINFADDLGDGVRLEGSTETYAPWPAWQLVDLNGDGFADLVNSVRAGGTFHGVNCAGESLDGGQYLYHLIPGSETRKVYLNNGTGWDEAPAMEQGLPVFQSLAILRAERDDRFHRTYYSDCEDSGWMGYGSPYTEICSTWMDLRPQFVELNGDGLLDLIVLEPIDPVDQWLSFFNEWSVAPEGTGQAYSRAWLQNADGSGWTPAPEFDLLGLAHIKFNHIPSRYYEGGGMKTLDVGVYLVDLNRDGLTDFVHDGDYSTFGDGMPGVLLNTGTGWCSDLGDGAAPCDTTTDHSRYDPPTRFTEWKWNYYDGYYDPSSTSQQLVFVDLNGDGWVDLLQGKGDTFDESNNPQTLRAWLHDPSAPDDSGGNPSVWVEKPEFAPPVPIRAGTQFVDLDGNGTADIIHGRTIIRDPDHDRWDEEEAYLAPDTHSDLLASVDNGRGGITDFTYVSAVVQRDAAMEVDAEAHAVILGDADGNSAAVTRFTPKPVISEQTLSGVGIAANVTTRYRYARPRFDPVERSGLGFGLVETTNPDNSSVDVYRYQREGLVGRPSVRKAFDEEGNQIRYSEKSWELASNPGSIPGALPGVFVARLGLQQSYNVYGLDEFGPSRRDVFHYDDTYGFNFLSEVTSFRATGRLTTIFSPDTEAYDEDKWLVGLVGEKRQLDAGITYSQEAYAYTADGQIEYRRRYIGPRDGSDPSVSATTTWAYDSWGNAISQTDTRGGVEIPRVVEFCYDGDGGGNSWCPSLRGGTPDTHSLRVGIRDAIGGVTELAYDWVMGIVLHVERINESGDFRDSMTVVRDAFGRSEERWFRGASFGGGDPDVQLTATAYHDAPVGSTPPYVEQFQFTGKVGEDPIRSAQYLDGFGNLFREVAKTPSGYRGTAAFRDPVTRTVRSVGPIDCDSDASCGNIAETTVPASEREVDVAGRVIRFTSPEGHDVTQVYSRMQRVQPAGSGMGDVFDAVEVTDPNNHTTRRLMDGDRVVWVDECQDSGCASPESTFYTYEATGEISAIYDAIATATGDYASPSRYLRYHYDTLGRVIQTDEPNTGSSSAEYDHQGNVTKTINVRQMETHTYYDPLGRVASIDRPDGVGEWDLDFTYDPTSRKRESVTTDDSPYSDAWEYDDFGQVKRQTRTFNDTMIMDFEYDRLGRPTKIYYPSSDSSASYEYEGAYLTKVCRGDVSCASTSSEYRLITGVVYDDLGRREDIIMPSGTVHREYYDTDDAESGRSINRLKRLAITAGTAAGALDFNYGYDSVGNITGIDDQSTTYNASATYTYDSRNRLKSWADANGDMLFYTYDALGNLERHGVTPGGATNQGFDPATRPHQIETNRIGEEYAYDADGNVIKRGATHFAYDSANRLVCTDTGVGQCDGPAYRYDSDGQLLWDGAAGQQLMGDLFRWKSQNWNAYSNIVAFGEVIAEVRQVNSPLRAAWTPVGWPLPIPKDLLLQLLAGAAVLTWIALLAWLGVWRAFSEAPATATLVLALTTLLVVPPPAWGCRKGRKDCGGGRSPVTTVRAFFRDHLGSAAYVTGPNVRQAYEPFGKAILTTPGTKDELTGKKYHNATDRYYFGARWYDAEAGRFAGVDPLVANARDPQDLNAYSYVRNDPVNLVDPTGMGAVPTPGIEEITITGTRGGGGSSFSGLPKFSFRASIPRYGVSAFSFGGSLFFAGGFGLLPGFTSIQFGMALDGYGETDNDECCDGSAGGDSALPGAPDGPEAKTRGGAAADAIEAGRMLLDNSARSRAEKRIMAEIEQRRVEAAHTGGDLDIWAFVWERSITNIATGHTAFAGYTLGSDISVPRGTPASSVPVPSILTPTQRGILRYRWTPKGPFSIYRGSG